MPIVRVDLDQLEVDLANAVRAEETAKAEAEAAARRHYEATQRRLMFERMRKTLDSYILVEGKSDAAILEGSAETVPPSESVVRRSLAVLSDMIHRPLSGSSGPAAVASMIARLPDHETKLDALFEQMVELGFEGTKNSVQVALSDAVERGDVERVRKGHYRFPPRAGETPHRLSDLFAERPGDAP